MRLRHLGPCSLKEVFWKGSLHRGCGEASWWPQRQHELLVLVRTCVLAEIQSMMANIRTVADGQAASVAFLCRKMQRRGQERYC